MPNPGRGGGCCRGIPPDHRAISLPKTVARPHSEQEVITGGEFQLEPTPPLMDYSMSAIINGHKCSFSPTLTSQLVSDYFEPASLKQDEALNHSPWGVRFCVLNWPQTTRVPHHFLQKEKFRAKGISCVNLRLAYIFLEPQVSNEVRG